jgi:hypothetical protein
MGLLLRYTISRIGKMENCWFFLITAVQGINYSELGFLLSPISVKVSIIHVLTF